MADIREQLLAAFEVEYREHLDAIRAALDRARAGESINVREIFRRAHSLKGAARAVDLPSIEEAAHTMEASFAEILESGGQADAALALKVAPQMDAIEREAAAVYNRGAVETAPVVAEAPPSPEFLRVDASRMQHLSSTMHDLSANLDQLDSDADDLGDLLARAESLARLLERPARTTDGQRLAQEARAVARGLRNAARAQKEVAAASIASAARLREELERVALVPASTVFAGLETMLRDLADESGKRVDIRIEGLDTQVDRLLLQSLRDPVMHLLRNAIVHGMESALDRHSIGKPERGEIGLKVMARAGKLEITVYDDGRGPDLYRIEEVAIRRELLPPREKGEPPPAAERLLALVFEPGFSTAQSVDRIAGRGMGLSVVAEAARRAGGGAFMRRRRPFGTEVVISTPLSASRQPLLLAYEGEQLYGLPTRALDGVVRAQKSDIERLDGRDVLKLRESGNNAVVPVVSLGSLVDGRAATTQSGNTVNIALLRLGEQRLGLQVDLFGEVRTGTVAAISHPDVHEIVQGAIQLERGEVAIVVNPEALMRRYARGVQGMTVAPSRIADQAQVAQRTILVVDDSVTTRTLERSILEASGFKVLLAVDGVDALERLRTAVDKVDLIVADVEMPRMDGFQLLTAVKGDQAFARIPMIMMTSRASPDDIRRGMELGADAYLVKQTFDQRELLTTIGQLI